MMEVEEWDAKTSVRWSQEAPSTFSTLAAGGSGAVCGACRSADCPAVEAAYVGHFDCLRHLHSEGEVINARDNSGSTPLHAAAEGGQMECAVFLVERTGAELRARDKIGNTPAHHAVFQGHAKLAKYLLANGASVADSTMDGASLQHYAAARGYLDILKWLCSAEAGGNPNEVDANGATPLYFAAQEGHEAVVEWLVDACDADVMHPTVDGMCALHAAAQAGRLGSLAFMTRHLRKRIALVRDNDGATCLHFAAARGHASCLRLLLQLPGATGEELDKWGASPAHDAAENGHVQCLRVLRQHDADLAIKDKEGKTPLQLAQAKGHKECELFLRGKSSEGNEELDLLENLRDLTGMGAARPKSPLESLFAGRGPEPDEPDERLADFGWDPSAVPVLQRDQSSRYRSKKADASVPDMKDSPSNGKSFWRLFGKKK